MAGATGRRNRGKRSQWQPPKAADDPHPPARRTPVRPPRRSNTGRTVLIVAAFAVFVGPFGILLAYQSSVSNRQQTRDRVQNTAKREFQAIDGHDWHEAWSLWSAAAQATVTADDFARGSDACGGPESADQLSVYRIDVLDTDHARATISNPLEASDYDFVREDGQWRFVPPNSWLSGYLQGIDAMIAGCAKAG